jgi:hypothetical protein
MSAAKHRFALLTDRCDADTCKGRSSLPPDARELLEPDLQVAQLKKADVLYRAGEPVTHVSSRTGGLISLIVSMESGQLAEVSLVGRDSMVRSGIVLDVHEAIDEATVEAGASASLMPAASFIRAYHSHERLRTLVNRHQAMVIAEVTSVNRL